MPSCFDKLADRPPGKAPKVTPAVPVTASMFDFSNVPEGEVLRTEIELFGTGGDRVVRLVEVCEFGRWVEFKESATARSLWDFDEDGFADSREAIEWLQAAERIAHG